MSKSYIPDGDAEFTNWFNQFKDTFSVYATGLGFSPGDTTALNNSLTSWQTKYTDHLSAMIAARAARQAKVDQREASETLIRGLVKRIQSNPSTTNQMRVEFGITVPKGDRTPIPAPQESPFIELECNERGQVIVHVGTLPTNERLNKYPDGVEFALIYFRVQGGEWEFAGSASTSPFLHTLNNETPLVVEYRARYQNPTGQVGPWCETDTAYVAPIQDGATVSALEEEAA